MVLSRVLLQGSQPIYRSLYVYHCRYQWMQTLSRPSLCSQVWEYSWFLLLHLYHGIQTFNWWQVMWRYGYMRKVYSMRCSLSPFSYSCLILVHKTALNWYKKSTQCCPFDSMNAAMNNQDCCSPQFQYFVLWLDHREVYVSVFTAFSSDVTRSDSRVSQPALLISKYKDAGVVLMTPSKSHTLKDSGK